MVSANHGFEGSDTPFTGASVVVTTDNDEALADKIADEVAADFLTIDRRQHVERTRRRRGDRRSTAPPVGRW